VELFCSDRVERLLKGISSVHNFFRVCSHPYCLPDSLAAKFIRGRLLSQCIYIITSSGRTKDAALQLPTTPEFGERRFHRCEALFDPQRQAIRHDEKGIGNKRKWLSLRGELLKTSYGRFASTSPPLCLSLARPVSMREYCTCKTTHCPSPERATIQTNRPTT